jgi:GDPmannose 4,6-dehydratase
MWRISQQGSAEDFVLGTGECHTIEEFAAEAFGYVGRIGDSLPKLIRAT